LNPLQKERGNSQKVTPEFANKSSAIGKQYNKFIPEGGGGERKRKKVRKRQRYSKREREKET